MSSAEPRPPATTASHPTQSDFDDIDASLLKSTVPLSSHVLLSGLMALCFTVAVLITLQAPLVWWILPAAIAIPVIGVLVERTNRLLKSRESARAMQQALDSARSPGTPGDFRRR